MSKVMTTHGYALLKSSLTSEEDISIRKQLTVKPNTFSKYGGVEAEEFPT